MKWGVVWAGFRWNAILTVLVTVVIIGSPPGFLIGVLIHFALRELCRVDPHIFRKLHLFQATKLRSMTGVIWGGSRLQPTHQRLRSASEVSTSV